MAASAIVMCPKCGSPSASGPVSPGQKFQCPKCGSVFGASSAPAAGPALDAAKPAAAGRVIAGHDLKSLIGKGVHSTTYRAVRRDRNQTVALKVFELARAKNPEWVRSYMESAKAVAKLAQPRLVRAFAMGSDQGFAFVSAELVESPSLETVLRKQGRLPPPAVARMLEQALGVLVEAETAAGIHRGSLRPSHFLVGPGGDLKILDFGSPGSPEEEEARLPFYMSPEEAGGASPDALSDLYSLGAIAYHALCGTPPFLADNPVQLRINISENAPLAAHEQDPGLPKGLSDVLARMMERDRARRFPSAREALGALRTVQPAPATPALAPLESGEASPGGSPALEAAGGAPAASDPIPTIAFGDLSLAGASSGSGPAAPLALAGSGGGGTAAAGVPAAPEVVAAAEFRQSKFEVARAIYRVVMWSIILGLLGGLGYYGYNEMKGPEKKEEVLPSAREGVQAKLRQARQFASENPGLYLDVINRYQQVVEEAGRTVEGVEAERAIQEWKSRYENAARQEWEKLYPVSLEMLQQDQFRKAYDQLTEFWTRYNAAQVAKPAADLRNESAERAKVFIQKILKKAEELRVAGQTQESRAQILLIQEHLLPPIEEEVKRWVTELEERFEPVAVKASETAEEKAKKIYDSYRQEMQPLAQLNDHDGALDEVRRFSARVEKQLEGAREGERIVWEKYRHWAEVDAQSLELVKSRWTTAVEKWVESHKGQKVKVGTTFAPVDKVESNRLYFKQGQDVFTEPAGMLSANEMLPLAFPKDEFLHGGVEIERGWWLLYQSKQTEATEAATSAEELKADAKDLREAIARWYYEGWTLSPLFTGKGSAIPESKGKVQLYYDFSSPVQATDWFALEGEHMIIRGMFYPRIPGTRGSFIQGMLPMISEVEISADVIFEREESLFRLGFMDPEGRHKEYHYSEISCRKVGYWIGTHNKMRQGNAATPVKIEPIASGVDHTHKVRLHWNRNKVRLLVDQREVQAYDFPGTGTWVPLIGNNNGKVIVDNLLVVGRPSEEWIARQAPALWLAKELRKDEAMMKLFNGRNTEGWKQFGNGRWTVINAGDSGILCGEGINPTLETGSPEWRNYIMSAQVRIPAGASVRLYVRRHPGKDPASDGFGTKDATQYALTCGQFVDCGAKKGPELYDWFSKETFAGNWYAHWHDLAVAVKGNYFSVFIDGRAYLQIEDNTFKKGVVGIYSNIRGEFRDIRLKLLQGP
ncbi:MAG: protein kinase [Planctomycetes bacterium]|nr:protein kinase [Planctomycetota bacterium]